MFIAGLTSGDVFGLEVWPKLWLAFLIFTSASAAMYLINDVYDKDVDAKHPKKKYRSIASGQLSPSAALLAATALMSISVIGVMALPEKSLLLLVAYLLMTVLYSLKLKSIRIIEILVVSTGFVLRIWFGASAINVPMSVWLCVCVYSGSTMIVIAKRHAELRFRDPQIVRAVVLRYKQKTLQIAGFITSLCLITSYVLWTLFGQQETITQRPLLYISSVPFILGVIKFCHEDRTRGVEEPEEFLLSDRTMRISGILFLSLLIFGIFVNS